MKNTIQNSVFVSFEPRFRRQRRKGFTLLQVLLVVGLIALLSAILIGQFGRGRASVRRVECDVHLKEISLAMETFRQETGHMPASLIELKEKGYVPLETLRCPADPALSVKGRDASYSSYGDYYVIREPQDSNDLPVAVCPFHEAEGAFGAQAFKGGYSKQFATRPALLWPADISGTPTITRPGKGVLALPTTGPLELRGGDRIETGAGTAILRFTDGSTASIAASSDMTVMQSYVDQQRDGALYTLVRQIAGKVDYYVKPGNSFDVATPTATAGALGTKFTIELASTASSRGVLDTVLTVQEHTVALTTTERTIEIKEREPAVAASDPANETKTHKPRKTKKSKSDD